jgi:DNA-binding response OmpR family regulator
MPNNHRILLVEDDPDTRAVLFTAFTTKGFSILTADNAEEARDLLDRGIRPRLILVDLIRPRASRGDLIEHLRAEAELCAIPTVVITGVPKREVSTIADAVICRPFDVATVVQTVRELITHH